MGLQKPHDFEKRVRFQYVVMIEKRDPFATSQSESLIRRRRNPFMLPNSRKSDAPVARGQCGQSIQQIGRAGAVVDQKELPVFIRLRKD